MQWLKNLFGFDFGSETLPISEEELEQEATKLATDSIDETVTADRLANRDERTCLPPLVYLEDDEQPHYCFRGGELIIGDGDDAVERVFPMRETVVVVTDCKILFIVGQRRRDKVWGVELNDVTETYVDNESWRRYIIVDAEANDDPLTFYADVTLESNWESFDRAVRYIETNGSYDA